MTETDNTEAAASPNPGGVVLFDGVCNVCNRGVDFLLRRDRRGDLRFASLQSEAGRRLLEERGVAGFGDVDSMRFVAGDRVYDRSDAVIRIAMALGFPYALAAVFLVVPRPVRDALYDAFARRRYRWFGVRSTCRVPTPEERARFL